MKKWFKKNQSLLIAMLVIGSLSVISYAETKVAVIDTQKLVQTLERGKEIQKKLESLSQGKKGKIDALQAEINTLEKELSSLTLNAQDKRKKAVQLQDKKTGLQRFVEDAQKEFEGQYGKELQALQDELMPIIQEIGKAQKFTIIFDLNNAGIAFRNQAIDITDMLIKEGNAKLAKGKSDQ